MPSNSEAQRRYFDVMRALNESARESISRARSARESASRVRIDEHTTERVLENLEDHRANGTPLTQESEAYLEEYRRLAHGEVPERREAPLEARTGLVAFPGGIIQTQTHNRELRPGDLITVDEQGQVLQAFGEEATGVFMRYVDDQHTVAEILPTESLREDPTMRVLETAASLLGGRAGQEALRQRDQMALREGQRRARMYSNQVQENLLGLSGVMGVPGTAAPPPKPPGTPAVTRPLAPKGGPIRKIIRKRKQ